MILNMVRLFSFFILIRLVTTKQFEEYSVSRNAALPPLFHLDDYSRCLSRRDGLYCEGELELIPLSQNNTQYRLIQEYTSQRYAFNRSLIHRGYCVSSRCPSKEKNSTIRFESCVSQNTKRWSLKPKLRTVNCVSGQVSMEVTTSEAQQSFLTVLYAILFLNVVGTAYDFWCSDSKKNDLITAWSLRSSLNRLLATYDDGDPRLKNLAAMQGIRVVALLLTMWGHSCMFPSFNYVTNPYFLETITSQYHGIIVTHGTAIIQIFVLLSSFLTGYNILLVSKKYQLQLKMVPLFVLKRIIRISPVHLLVIGYAATWWPLARESPLMTSVVGAESAICRRKFWSHVFFVNNMVDAQESCLLPTWFLAADMHLYILACVLTIVMIPRRQHALKMYAALVVISLLFNAVILTIKGWRPIILITNPNSVRSLFRHEESVFKFYMSSWAALPTCFLGLFMAHLHYELEEKQFDYSKAVPWLKRLYTFMGPASVLWTVFLPKYVRDNGNSLMMAIYAVIERPAVCLFGFSVMFGLFNFEGPLRRLLSGRGGRVAARLSLPAMLTHWCVNALIAAKPHAYEVSDFSILCDLSATVVFTLMTSLMLSLFVEIPVQRFMSRVLF